MNGSASPSGCGRAFLAIVIALLAFDLGVLHKEDKEMGVAESLKLSAFYIGFAIALRRLDLVGL